MHLNNLPVTRDFYIAGVSTAVASGTAVETMSSLVKNADNISVMITDPLKIDVSTAFALAVAVSAKKAKEITDNVQAIVNNSSLKSLGRMGLALSAACGTSAGLALSVPYDFKLACSIFAAHMAIASTTALAHIGIVEENIGYRRRYDAI